MKFYYHYHKPKSQQLGQAIISLHYNNKCHLIKGIKGLEINVPTYAKINKKQPYFVMVGKASKIYKNKKGTMVLI